MPDHLRNDGSIQTQMPDRYSRLLEPRCLGHALLWPKTEADVTGSLGDGGYIEKGTFHKMFNVFFDPPLGLPGLPTPTPAEISCVERDNTSTLRSSHKSHVSFTTSVGSETESVSLPFTIVPTSVDATLTLNDDEFAYLGFAGLERRVETLTRPMRSKICTWLARHYRQLYSTYCCDIIILTETTRACGWVGGVARARSAEVGGGLSSRLLQTLRFAIHAGRKQNVEEPLVISRGPNTSIHDSPVKYTVVVGYVAARTWTRTVGRLSGIRVGTSDGESDEAGTSRDTGSRTPHGLQTGSDNSSNTTAPTSSSGYTTPESDNLSTIIVDAGSQDADTLSDILDDALLRLPRDDNTVIVADWSIIFDYVETNNEFPQRGQINYTVLPSTGAGLDSSVLISAILPKNIDPYGATNQHDSLPSQTRPHPHSEVTTTTPLRLEGNGDPFPRPSSPRRSTPTQNSAPSLVDATFAATLQRPRLHLSIPGPITLGTVASTLPQIESFPMSFMHKRRELRPPRKRALLIGIEYGVLPRKPFLSTWSKLRAPHNDVLKLQGVLKHCGFQRMRVMLDSPKSSPEMQPTKTNILRELDNLVKDAQSGDKLFFCYSGYGKQPTSDVEEEYRRAEYIVPVDAASSGIIIDDVLHEALVKRLPHGVKLFAVFDSCHSGRILDLHYYWELNLGKGTILPRYKIPPISPTIEEISIDKMGRRAPAEFTETRVVCLSAAQGEKVPREQSTASFLKFFAGSLSKRSHITVGEVFVKAGIFVNETPAVPSKSWELEGQSQDPSISSDNSSLILNAPLTEWF